ncbi:hypothetical protein SAMN05446037_101252 [Anaerovirgula multivorans]|uniref:Uncharacterized protein n=1 Tax=Anaerovirgula multivorans TaxID=312168 RepID=A0A239F8W3_9FIRM|nr:hypothetical protein SAMN05446037_101252 [Anaerovirgula multivorans]
MKPYQESDTGSYREVWLISDVIWKGEKYIGKKIFYLMMIKTDL